ncbi:MAG: hypothetical protein WD045_09415 [Pirellulaceae bacterium]
MKIYETLLVVSWALFISLGCSPDSGVTRYNVTGQVTYNGVPVPMGEISFDPLEQGIGGGFAPINDGRFDTTIDGRGHLGGEHRVQIVGFKGWIDPSDPDKGAIPLFTPYETTVDFSNGTSTMDFEVPSVTER